MYFLAYLIIALTFFFTIKGIIQSIKSKKLLNLLADLMFIPFQFFFFITLLFGGSAGTEQAGHYYLVSHGQWTEVSHGKYIVVLISEIVGVSTFIIAFVLNLIRAYREKLEK